MHSRSPVREEQAPPGTSGSHRLKPRAASVTLVLFAVAALARAASPASPRSADDAYLDRLLGRWEIVGTVHGKAVHYRAKGERVLDGGFLRLHMIDVAPTPAYVADVFVGYDPKRHDFIAHWLDRFGAAGARVVATGVRDGDRLVIVFPYEEGAFRDTFTWHAERHEWQLLLEAQETTGDWSVFADFTLRRSARAGSAGQPGTAAPPTRSR
jgi:hypothetical protein